MADSYKLIGCLPYSDVGSGYCLPVFLSSQKNGSYIQNVTHLGDKIDRFIRLDDDMEGLLDLSHQISVRTGDQPIYVVRLPNQFIVGTFQEVGNALRSVPTDVLGPLFSKKWLGTFGGSIERLDARKKTLQRISNIMCYDARKYFEKSIF